MLFRTYKELNMTRKVSEEGFFYLPVSIFHTKFFLKSDIPRKNKKASLLKFIEASFPKVVPRKNKLSYEKTVIKKEKDHSSL